MERIGGTLRDLGLTGNAADAFCTLVRMGRATARELVVKTGIPDSKIYYALAELADKGLIEVQGGKPKTYRIVPPREVELRLGRIVEEDYERRRAATTRLGSILEPLRAATESPSTDVAYIVKGLPNVVSRARSLITSARKEIVFLASDESLFRKVETWGRPPDAVCACSSPSPTLKWRKTSRKGRKSARSSATACSSWRTVSRS